MFQKRSDDCEVGQVISCNDLCSRIFYAITNKDFLNLLIEPIRVFYLAGINISKIYVHLPHHINS